VISSGSQDDRLIEYLVQEAAEVLEDVRAADVAVVVEVESDGEGGITAKLGEGLENDLVLLVAAVSAAALRFHLLSY
jgi:hypothetical protein